MIRTVLGDIPSVTGNVLTHEHILCASGEMLYTQGQKWLDISAVEEFAVAIYTNVRQKYGVSLIVDGTPCDLGRNIGLIRRVSERTGIHFVASTGLYHFPSALSCMRTADDLAAIFTDEAANGIGDSSIRPGILKCAVDREGFTADCAKRVRALAITRRETGLPLYAHCHFVENTAHTLLDILESEKADLSGVVLGHATSRLEVDYLTGLLARGCYLGFDQCFAGGESRCAVVVAQLCKRGFADRLLFSLDRPLYNDFETPDRTGLQVPAETHIARYGFLFSHMLPAFRNAGCTDDMCYDFVQKNPAAFLHI